MTKTISSSAPAAGLGFRTEVNAVTPSDAAKARVAARIANIQFGVSKRIQRWCVSTDFVLAGLLASIFDHRGRDVLSAELYDADGRYRGAFEHPWEADFFRDNIGEHRARILVLGCGSGRELDALHRMGHEVTGFDPAPHMVDDARQRVPHARVLRGSLHDFATGVLSGEGELSSLQSERFDAVLFGWGVILHTHSQSELERVGRATQFLCAMGPWLGSYNQFSTSVTESGAFRLGYELLSRLRGQPVPQLSETESELCFTPYGGFSRLVRPAHVESWARSMNRTVRFEGVPGEPVRFVLTS